MSAVFETDFYVSMVPFFEAFLAHIRTKKSGLCEKICYVAKNYIYLPTGTFSFHKCFRKNLFYTIAEMSSFGAKSEVLNWNGKFRIGAVKTAYHVSKFEF